MTRFLLHASLALVLLNLAACGKAPAPPAQPPTASAAPREQLKDIVERYWDAYLALNPLEATAAGDHRYDDRLGNPLSAQYLADSLALERRSLAELMALRRVSMDAEARLTYDVFKRGRELAIEGFTYPSELLPVNQFEGMPQQFAMLGSGAGTQPFATIKDYENWLARIDDYVRWTAQAIANMQDGMRRGYSLPRGLIERTLPRLASLGEDSSASVFYQPQRSMPKSIIDPQRSRLAQRLTAAVQEKILPAYRTLHDFLQNEYLPRARDSAALSALPLGAAWYAYRVRQETATNLTPIEIHNIGLAEVERIRMRMQGVFAEAAFVGDPQSYFDLLAHDPRQYFKSGDDLVSAYRDLKVKVAAATPDLFKAAPQGDFEIRAAEPIGAAAAPPLWYQGAAPDGKAPAVLHVNASDVPAHPAFCLESLFLGNAAPGRHYQFALQQERLSLPRFRRFGMAAGFVEGWALYAESLGEELGLDPDPAAKFGVLLSELRHAVGLVAETGLQSKGWTRQQALGYLHAQMPIADRDAIGEVDRYLALPGQSLAPKIGELKIRAMRVRAQQRLGARFDIGAFHSEVLRQGAIPLDLLEAQIDAWIDATLRPSEERVAQP
jgi:uncharacterized protein (DUF885 family)